MESGVASPRTARGPDESELRRVAHAGRIGRPHHLRQGGAEWPDRNRHTGCSPVPVLRRPGAWRRSRHRPPAVAARSSAPGRSRRTALAQSTGERHRKCSNHPPRRTARRRSGRSASSPPLEGKSSSTNSPAATGLPHELRSASTSREEPNHPIRATPCGQRRFASWLRSRVARFRVRVPPLALLTQADRLTSVSVA